MSASNDFFVKFDSNALTWSNQLDTQLSGARKAIETVDILLSSLNRKGDLVGSNLRKALAQDLNERSGGGDAKAGSGDVNTRRLVSDMAKSADQIDSILNSLTEMVRRIQILPNTVQTAIRSVAGVGNQRQGAAAQVVNPNTNAFTKQSDPNAVNAQINSILKRAAVAPAPAPVRVGGIASVGSQAVSEAGFTRVVNAIEAQTKQLTSALGSIKVESARLTADAEVETRKGKKKKSKQTDVETDGPDGYETSLAKSRSHIAEVKNQAKEAEAAGKARLAQIEAEFGKESQQYASTAAAVKTYVDERRATASKMERDLLGATKSDQKKERQKAAAEVAAKIQAQPVIPPQEMARRKREQTILGSVINDPLFAESVGRKKGDYGVPELKEMARAFTEQGFNPGFKSKDKMDDMARKLVDVGEQFKARNETEWPENIRTQGFNTYRETEVPEGLQKALTVANDKVMQDYAKEIQENRDLIRRSYSGGDTGENVGRRLSRNRREFGSGFNAEGGYTEEEIRQAEARIAELRGMGRQSTLNLARSDTFDPYNPAMTAGLKKGNTPEERLRHDAALLQVSQMRNHTEQIDRSARSYYEASRNISDFSRAIDYVQTKLSRDAMSPADGQMDNADRRRMEDQLRDYRASVESSRKAQSLSRGDTGDLFDDPDFKKGFENRIQSFADLQQRRETMRTTERFSANQDLRNATGNYIARPGIVPGLRYDQFKGNLSADGVVAKDLNKEQSQDLNSALGKFVNKKLARETAFLEGADEKTFERAEREVENAAVHLLSRIEKYFNGLAPTFQSLTDQDIKDPKNAEGELKRQRARETAASNLKNLKVTDLSPEIQAEKKQQTLARATADLEDARTKAAAAAAAVAEQDKALADTLATLTPAERKRVEAAQDQVRQLTQQKSALSNINLLEDPAARDEKNKVSDDRREVQIAERKIAAARRSEAAFRGQVTRKTNEGDTEGAAAALVKVKRAQGRIVAFIGELDTATKAMEARTELLRRDTEREGHTPGEKKRVAPAEYNRLSQIEETLDEFARGGVPKDKGEAQAQSDFIAQLNAERDKLRGEVQEKPDLGDEKKRLEKELSDARDLANKGYPQVDKSAAQAKAQAELDEATAAVKVARDAYVGAVKDNNARVSTPDYEDKVVEPLLDKFVATQKAREAAEGRLDLSKSSSDGGERAAELQKLLAEGPARIAAIASAREEGDLKENTGYHAAREEEARAQARIAELQKATSTPVDNHEELRQKAKAAAQEVARLEAEVAGLATKSKKAAEAVEDAAVAQDKETASSKKKKGEATTKKADPAASAEIDALRKERATLRKQGPYTRTDVKGLAEQSGKDVGRVRAAKGQITRATNKADEAALAAAKKNLAEREKEAAASAAAYQSAATRKNRISEINNRLNELDGRKRGGGDSGTGGTGGGKSGRSGSTPGGGDILNRILAAINAVNSTLKKGGIKVSGVVEGKTTPTRTTTPKKGGVEAQAMAAERKRLGLDDDDLPAKPKKVAPLKVGATDEEKAAYAQEVADRKAAIALRKRLEDARRAQAIARKAELVDEGDKQVQARATRQSEQASAKLREQALAAEQLRAALLKLTPATKAEVDALRQLSNVDTSGMDDAAKAAHQADLARKQVSVYGGIDRDLRENLIAGPDRKNAAQAVLNDAGPQVNSNQLNQIARTSRSFNPATVNRAVDSSLARNVPSADQSEWMQEWGNGLFGDKGFWGRIVGSTGAFIVRNFAAGAVFGLTNALQGVLDQALQTEMTFVRVSQALEATNKPIGNLRADLQDISTDYGVALNDVYTSAASLQGLFSSTEDLAIGTRVSTQLQVISNGALNATEAVGVLASTYTAFQNSVESNLAGTGGLERIADTFTLIQNELGVNLEVSAEAVSSMAGAAESMGLSFQEAAVYGGQIAKLTNQSGAAAGEQFSRILAATQTGRGKNALQDAFKGVVAGPGTPEAGRDLGLAIETAGAQGDLGDVLKNVMLGWNDLTKSQQNNLAVALGGQRNLRAFQALMNDTEGTMALLTKSYRANGDAQERMDAIVATLNKRIEILRENFNNLASALIRTGILNFFGAVLLGVNKVLEVLNEFLGKFNKLAESNSAVGMLRDMATFAIGAAVAFKILGASVGGLRSSLRSMRSENTSPVVDPTVTAPRPVVGAGVVNSGGSSQRASYLEQRVARPGFGNYGVAGPQSIRDVRGFQTGVSKAVAFGADRAIRVPVERFGRIVERGGMRWERSNNRLISSLGGLRGTGQYIQRGAQGFGEGLQNGFGSRPSTGNLRSANLLGSFGEKQMAAAASRSAFYGDKFVRTQDLLGRSAVKASAGINKTAGAFSGLARSGLGADAALIGVGLAIAAIVSYRSQINELKDVATKAAAAYKPVNEADADDIVKWVGPATDKMKEAAEKFERDGSSVGDRFANAFGSWSNFKDGFTQFSSDATENSIANDKFGVSKDYDIMSSSYAFRDKLGDSPLADDFDGRYLTGFDETATMYNEALDRLGDAASGQLGYIPDALQEGSDQFRKDLEQQVKVIQGDASLGEGERVAKLALIEALDQAIADAYANKLAIGFGLTSSLESDQISALQTTIGQLSAVREGKGSLGGVKVGGVIDKNLSNIGADPGSELEATLADLQAGGLNSAQTASAQLSLMQDALKAAQANWLAELEKGADTEGFQAADQQLSSLMNEMAGIGEQLIGQIVSEAEALAQTAELAGQYGKAARIRLRAMAGVEQIEDQLDPANDPSANAVDTPRGLGAVNGEENAKGKKRRRSKDPALVAGFSATVQNAIFLATKDITLQIAQTSDAALRAGLESLRANITNSINTSVANGTPIAPQLLNDLAPKAGADAVAAIPKSVQNAIDNGSKSLGDSVVSQQQLHDSQVSLAEAQTSAADAQVSAADETKNAAAEARANAAALRQAQLGVSAAWADARGDAVAGARIQVAVAKATMAAAQADLAAASTASETAAARVAVLNAQASLIGANAAVQAAQADLVQSQYEVSIAMATAAGNTVEASRRTLAAARAALNTAMKKSRGKATAEVNAAKVSLIQAQASARDAALQDQLDTIDFNLEMGKTTQSAAISALQEILRTSDLTKAQRRQLLLQIKGMKDEMADSQWNFGDINLPTPYQMRRYIKERRDQFTNQLESAAQGKAGRDWDRGGSKPKNIQAEMNAVKGNNVSNSTTTILINGADTGAVKKIIKETVGSSQSVRTKTTGARRGWSN